MRPDGKAAGAVTGPPGSSTGSLADRVVRWQREHGRHSLPWQASRDPYRVWLSEVMLQQTQVATVLDYYARFVSRFPTVAALAAAPQDDVLAAWSGLGYYSRARNLHRCAIEVVEGHGGVFPSSSAVLATLPGIGRSTAAAIAAFCFGERAAILDGNVKRVLTRATGFHGDLAAAAPQRQLWALAESLLPDADVDVYTQGLMDLGATVCTTRRPACLLCPLAADCVALREGRPQHYPVKTKTLRRGSRENALLWAQHRGRWWLVQRPQTGVWAGLWTLPEYPSKAALELATSTWAGDGSWLPEVRHVLTHFDWTLHPLAWRLPETEPGLPAAAVVEEVPVRDEQPGRWMTPDEALALGLPAPVRRLFEAAVDVAAVGSTGGAPPPRDAQRKLR